MLYYLLCHNKALSETQSWGNLVTCNLSYVINITLWAKSNITKLLFSHVICNCNNITLSEVIYYFPYILHKSPVFLVKLVFCMHVHR